MHMISGADVGGGSTLYQLKITLNYSDPPIWRRVVVRSDWSLGVLDAVIQIAMGWTNSHMHQFIVGSRSSAAYYGPADPAFADLGAEMLDENKYSVADIAPAARKKFMYEYDFGDGWRHEVKVEKILPADSKFKHPVCLAGEKAGPPEDCGGVGGYYDLLEILADPKHPEHEDTAGWLGNKYDADRFDLDAVNKVLKKLKP